jgi:hypothetical protein
MQRMQQMEAEQEGTPEEQSMDQTQMLSEEDEKDIDIAVARAMEFIESPSDGGPDGVEVLTKLLSGKNPEQQLAMFFTQMIEAVMMDAQDAGLEINPVVWFAEGGAIDEITTELDDLLQGQFDIVGMMPAVKEQIRKMLGERGQQLKAQMESGQQQSAGPPQGPQGAPPDERPPLLARG